ncbi:hypothetical protein [Bacillus sp. J33]|uniref:hypothetical protein n=1 Tax=Bacillus sp. J33 TaxID=935836 RepID=UPI0004B6480E|nr:hypothetical protein [Bacillus sp. J33]
MKKFISLFLVAMLTIGLAACNSNEGASGSGDGGEKEDQLVFGYTSMTQNNPFFQVL